MPQWDFLNFLAEQGKRFPTFHVRMQADVKELIEEDGKVVGVHAVTPTGPLEVRATLTVGCDGRHSTVRERADFVVHDLGSPIDVLWMRISRRADDPFIPLGRFDRGHILVMIYRGRVLAMRPSSSAKAATISFASKASTPSALKSSKSLRSSKIAFKN